MLAVDFETGEAVSPALAVVNTLRMIVGGLSADKFIAVIIKNIDLSLFTRFTFRRNSFVAVVAKVLGSRDYSFH
jgi:hypothetical protein